MMTTRTKQVFLVRHARPCAGHPRPSSPTSQTWMAGHRRAEATPSFGRLCPAMTAETDVCRSYPDHPQPQRDVLAVMRMRDGDGERVGGVGGFRFGFGQQNLQYQQNLVLVGVAGPDHRLPDLVPGVFRNRDPEHRWRQHRYAPRLSKF